MLLMVVLLLPVVLGAVSNSSDRDRQRAFFALNRRSLRLSQEEAFELRESSMEETATLDSFAERITPTQTPRPAPGSAGFGLDVMHMLRLTNPDTLQAQRRREKLELFYMSSRGELDTASMHLPAAVLAAMHMNETGGSTFLDGIYGEARGRFSSTDMTLSRFTGAMARELGLSGRYGVWVDRDTYGGDGFPDGPFQIQSGAPSPGNNARISTLSGTGHLPDRDFDIFFFPDSLSWVNHESAQAVARYQVTDPREAFMLSSAIHNRGSVNRQAWGLPYTADGLIRTADFVNTTAPETFRQVRVLFTDLLSAFSRHQPPIPGLDGQTMRQLGVFLLLSTGWYVENVQGLGFLNNANGPTLLAHIFPEASGIAPTDFIRDNFYRRPWDVIGITQAQFAVIYGMNRESYSNYYRYDSLFKVSNETSPLYVNRMPDGSYPPILHVWDNVAIGHITGTAFMGEVILLNWFLEAGLPTEIDGNIVDPTNPSSVYRRLSLNNPNSFIPMSRDFELIDNFEQLISMMEISTTSGRLASLFHTYEQAGTKYWFGGGGRKVSAQNHARHLYFANSNRPYEFGADFLNNVLYRDRMGNPYQPGITLDHDLELYGRRLFDCAVLAMAGPSLGQTSPDGSTMRFAFYSGAILENSHAAEGSVILTIDGVDFDVGMYRASNNAHRLSAFRDNPELSNGGLQPGDILATRGHAFTILGVAPRDMVLPANIARSGTSVPIRGGSIITIEGWQTGQFNRVRDKGWNTDNRYYYVIRTWMMRD